jgi:hypothetical protein
MEKRTVAGKHSLFLHTAIVHYSNKWVVYTKSWLLIHKTVKWKNKYIFLICYCFSVFCSCNEDSIDKQSDCIRSNWRLWNSDDVAAANLVTKLSFEGNLTDSKIAFLVSLEKIATAGIKGTLIQGPALRKVCYSKCDNHNHITKWFYILFWMNSANTVAPQLQDRKRSAKFLASWDP